MSRIDYWIVNTDHLEEVLLFRDDEDFCTGMNYVAVQAFKSGVFVLEFILMSNHMHFVLAGTRAQVDCFINGFKSAYSRYIWKKYGDREVLRRNKVRIERIDLSDESLEWALAYVRMNCVAAGICLNPADYRWGTGGCFFQVMNADEGGSSGRADGGGPSGRSRTLASLSARERYRLIHTKAVLPGEWVICEEGFIKPESFIKKVWVERRFRNPERMEYFLRNSSKAKARLSASEDRKPSFRDQIILAAIPDLCHSLFRTSAVKELEEQQLVELMRQVRFRFAANVKQIARVTGVTYKRAEELLDRA